MRWSNAWSRTLKSAWSIARRHSDGCKRKEIEDAMAEPDADMRRPLKGRFSGSREPLPSTATMNCRRCQSSRVWREARRIDLRSVNGLRLSSLK